MTLFPDESVKYDDSKPGWVKTFDDMGWQTELLPSGNWQIKGYGNTKTYSGHEFDDLQQFNVYETQPTTTDAHTELVSRRRKDGQCIVCGDLLPMSAWGLGDCPQHPGVCK